jgi:uncharacterized protein
MKENVSTDISREGLTPQKLTHFLRVLLSTRATEVLGAYSVFSNIDFDELWAWWKRWIILDVDECIAPHHGDILPQNLEHIRNLIKKWWRIVIFSNMKKNGRYKELEEIWIKVITSAFAKPDKRWFLECAQSLQVPPHEIIMIGDNYLTDWGSRNAGIDFVKIKPVDTWDISPKVSRRIQITVRDLIDWLAKNRWNLNYK